MRLLISRTDAIGDVCLTLPAIGWLKSVRPDWHISILVKPYAAPVTRASKWLDSVNELPDGLNTLEMTDWLRNIGADHLIHVFPNKLIARAAKKAGIHRRSGVTGRIYHWFSCTDVVWMSRARSKHHEAYLNILLLAKILNLKPPTPSELVDNFVKWGGIELPLGDTKIENPYVILHPYSRGSGREWPISHYAKLANMLVEHGYVPVVGGTATEAVAFAEHADEFPQQTMNVMGCDSLSQYMLRINASAALIVSGTGPLHIASLLGTPSVGLFPPVKSIDSRRWGAIGINSTNLELMTPCTKKCSNTDCSCLSEIRPESVMNSLTRNLRAQAQS